MKSAKVLTGSFILVLAAVSARAACFSTAGTPAGGDITLPAAAALASRISGVAPLSVFFDGSGASATSTANPFRDLAYCWDFADPGSGSFSTTGRTKNEARGPVAAHVFETPSATPYTVTLTVRDGQGREAVRTVQVTVQDPDAVFAGANTRCFANGPDTPSNFSGCPAGATRVPNVAALSALQSHVGPNRRLLLCRGDTFVRDTRLNIFSAGPGHVGAFGTGAAPRVTTDDSAVQLSDDDTFASDWRVSDLRFENSSLTAHSIDIGGGSVSQRADFLFLRLSFDGGGSVLVANIDNFGTSTDAGRPNDIPDGITVQDSEFTRGNAYLMYVSARRFAVMGTRVSDDRGVARQTLNLQRYSFLSRTVFSDNESGPCDQCASHLLYIHAPTFEPPYLTYNGVPGAGEYTERVLVSGNIFRVGAAGGSYVVHIGPQNAGATSDERFRDVIVERNLFLMGPRDQGVHFDGPAQRATVRENLFYGQGGETNCVNLDSGGPDAASPSDVLVSHNTCAGSGEGNVIWGEPGVSGVAAYNNLAVGPTRRIFWGGGTLAAQSGNVLAIPAQAQLTAWPPVQWQDYRPTNATAVSGDAAYPWAWDFSDVQRIGAPEAGALEADTGPADTLPPARPRNLRVR